MLKEELEVLVGDGTEVGDDRAIEHERGLRRSCCDRRLLGVGGPQRGPVLNRWRRWPRRSLGLTHPSRAARLAGRTRGHAEMRQILSCSTVLACERERPSPLEHVHDPGGEDVFLALVPGRPQKTHEQRQPCRSLGRTPAQSGQ